MIIRNAQKKVNEYAEDDVVSNGDNIIGQDSSNFNVNKTYSVGDLKVYVTGGEGIAGQVLKNNGDETWSFYDKEDPVTTTTTTKAHSTFYEEVTTTTTTLAPETTTTTTTDPSITTTTTTSAVTTTTTTSSQTETPGTVVDVSYWKLVWLQDINSQSTLIGDPYGSNYVATQDDGWTSSASTITDLQGQTYYIVANRGFKIDQTSIQVGAFVTDSAGVFINSNNTHDTNYNREYNDFSTPMYASIKTSMRSGTNITINETTLVKVEQYNGYIRITEVIDITP